MTIRSLGYVHWRSPKAEAWRAFGRDALGLMDSDGPDGSVDFRWDDRSYRLRITPADEIGIGALGFQVADEEELDDLEKTLRDAGVEVTIGTAEERAERDVNGLIHFADPDGIPLEAFYGPILRHEPLLAPLVSRFLTGEMGMGHAVIATDDLQRSSLFYRKVLGFHMRNTMVFKLPDPYPPAPMEFFGCNPRHHTLGVFQYPIPGRLLHVMIEVGTIDDVGAALDRCVDLGFAIPQGIGRHSNDHMVSFYCAGPDGMQVEFGYDAIQITDPDAETQYEITKTSFWGHRPLKP